MKLRTALEASVRNTAYCGLVVQRNACLKLPEYHTELPSLDVSEDIDSLGLRWTLRGFGTI